MNNRFLCIVLLSIFVSAMFLSCTKDGNNNDPAAESGRAAGSDTDSNDECEASPSPDATWLMDYLDDTVASLSGAQEIASGVFLDDRRTDTNKEYAREFIAQQLADAGYAPQQHDYGNGVNVYATLAATNGETGHYIIGAHYDSVLDCPGANDNATGTAVVLAMAEYLSDLDCRNANVTFVFFDEEEKGSIGSGHFSQLLQDDEWDIIEVHTIDQMGWDSDGDWAIEIERPDAFLFEFYQEAVTSGGFSIPLHESSVGGTDHISFRPQFDAVGITEEYASGDTTPYIHCHGEKIDSYDSINFEYLKSTTVLLNFAFAQELNP